MIARTLNNEVRNTLVIVIMVIICLGSSSAQPTTDWTARQSLRSALNAARVTLLTRGLGVRDSESVSLVGIGDIVLRRFDGTCDTLRSTNPSDSLNRITLITDPADPYYMTLRVPTRGPTAIKIGPGSHPMVCDLNGWLWNAWGADFANSKNPFVVDDNLFPGSACTPVGQQYYMGEGDLDDHPELYDTLDKYSAAGPYLWQKEYIVPESGGDTMRRQGLHFYNILRPNDRLTFVARHPAGSPNILTDTARPANIRFERDPQAGVVGPPSGVKVLNAFSFLAQTQKYAPTDDCNGTPMVGDGPLVGKARITMTIEYKNALGVDQTPISCQWDFDASSDPDVNNAAMWEQFDIKHGELGNNFIQKWGRFEIDSLGYLYFHTIGGGGSTCVGQQDTFYLFKIRDPNVPAEYCDMRLPRDGVFCMDDMSGQLKFNPGTTDCPCDPCTPIDITCLEFCETISGYLTMTGVIGASATVLSDSWPYDHVVYGSGPSGSNRYETGEDGQWRSQRGFVYKSRIRSANQNTSTPWHERNYADAGVFVNQNDSLTDAFRLFNWRDLLDNPSASWIRIDSVTAFSPFGEPIEQRDIIGVYSSAGFAHRNTVPNLVAKNARVASVAFESFEDGNGTVTDAAHTGEWSFRLADDGSWSDRIARITVDQQLLDEGLLIKVWVKQTYLDYTTTEIPIRTNIAPVSLFSRVAQTGEWTLYELQIPNIGSLPGSPSLDDVLEVKFANDLDQVNADDHVWIDDIRLQPLFSEMTCFVYDPATLRLTAQFDDQHFARIFQYNGEGKLVRKLVETERGLKTVTESQYHTPQWLTFAGTPPMMNPGRGGLGNVSSSIGLSDGDDRTASTASGTSFDLLDVEIGTEGITTSLFGNSDAKAISYDSLKSLSLPSWDILSVLDTASLELPELGLPEFNALPIPERLKLIGQAYDFDQLIHRMESLRSTAADDEARTRIDEELARLREERRRIVEERLGVSEEELHTLYNEVKLSPENSSEPNK